MLKKCLILLTLIQSRWKFLFQFELSVKSFLVIFNDTSKPLRIANPVVFPNIFRMYTGTEINLRYIVFHIDHCVLYLFLAFIVSKNNIKLLHWFSRQDHCMHRVCSLPSTPPSSPRRRLMGDRHVLEEKYRNTKTIEHIMMSYFINIAFKNNTEGSNYSLFRLGFHIEIIVTS